MTVTPRSQPRTSPSCRPSDDPDAFPSSPPSTPPPPSTPRPFGETTPSNPYSTELLNPTPIPPTPSTPITTPPPHPSTTSTSSPFALDPMDIDTPSPIDTDPPQEAQEAPAAVVPPCSSLTDTAVTQPRSPSTFKLHTTSGAKLPPIPRLPLPPTPTIQQRQQIRQKYVKPRPTMQHIDDRAAVALARVPDRRALQQKRRRKFPLTQRVSRGTRCERCNVHCPTPTHYSEHIKSRRHQRAGTQNKLFHCKTCSVDRYSLEDYQRHLQSKAHRNQLNLSHSKK